MKKWWFSIICYVMACILLLFPIVGAWFLDYESWWVTTQIISVLSSCLLLIIIGVANQPRKDNKE